MHHWGAVYTSNCTICQRQAITSNTQVCVKASLMRRVSKSTGLLLLLLVQPLLLGVLLLLLNLQQGVSEGNVACLLLLPQSMEAVLQHSLPALQRGTV